MRKKKIIIMLLVLFMFVYLHLPSSSTKIYLGTYTAMYITVVGAVLLELLTKKHGKKRIYPAIAISTVVTSLFWIFDGRFQVAGNIMVIFIILCLVIIFPDEE